MFTCPICNGTPVKRTTKIACDYEDCCNPYEGGKCSLNHKPYVIETTCDFCEGKGFLDKEPIPIIIGWRKE